MSKVKLPNFLRRTKLLQTISAMGIYSGKSIEVSFALDWRPF